MKGRHVGIVRYVVGGLDYDLLQETKILRIICVNRGYVVSLRQKVNQMEQIERIKQMELRMEHAAKAVMELSVALDNYEAVQEDLTALSEYYDGEAWKQDYTDDEAGRLPADLKRGVLSEDGIWNLLSDANELNKRLQRYKAHAEPL